MQNATASFEKFPDDARQRVGVVSLALDGAMNLVGELNTDIGGPILGVVILVQAALDLLAAQAEGINPPALQAVA